MKTAPLQQRPYQDVVAQLRHVIMQKPYVAGDRLPAERDIAEQFNVTHTPGIQRVYALTEVTGGGQKVYGIAIEYDVAIDAQSLTLQGFQPPFSPRQTVFLPVCLSRRIKMPPGCRLNPGQ